MTNDKKSNSLIIVLFFFSNKKYTIMKIQKDGRFKKNIYKLKLTLQTNDI